VLTEDDNDRMDVDPPAEDLARRPLRLRYPAKCAKCAIDMPGGTDAWYGADKKVYCLACVPTSASPNPGTAGASAAAEGERRLAKRVDRVRKQYGDFAADVARKIADNEISKSWGKGAEGESRLARWIANEVGDHVIPLHDRLIPGTRGNIDHMFVAPTGVWVVDAKTHKGTLVRREVGPIWRRTNEVWVAKRNRSNLAVGVVRQVTAVLAALEPDPDFKGTNVYGVLCFLDAEWGLMDFPFQVGNVWVMYAKALRKRLKKDGSLSRDEMERIALRLDLSLPRAG
jgi:hypothetical protein